jgi:hypothetical protein
MKQGAVTCVAAIIAAVALLSGCDLGGRSENIKPGEADYPVENLQPTRVLHLVAIVPQLLPVHFLMGYVASKSGGPMQSGTACSYSVGLGPARQYSINASPQLTRVGDTYTANIVVDRYESGRCGWRFARIWYVVANMSPDQSELLFLDGGSDHPASARADIWCIKSEKRDPKLPEACNPIWALRSQFPELVSKSLYESIKLDGGDAGPPIHSGSVREFTVQFHDMNAPDGDLAVRTE